MKTIINAFKITFLLFLLPKKRKKKIEEMGVFKNYDKAMKLIENVVFWSVPFIVAIVSSFIKDDIAEFIMSFTSNNIVSFLVSVAIRILIIFIYDIILFFILALILILRDKKKKD